MAGRKPKPTAIKKLEGNPGKRKLNTKEPIPAKGMPECPQWLLAEGCGFALHMQHILDGFVYYDILLVKQDNR